MKTTAQNLIECAYRNAFRFTGEMLTYTPADGAPEFTCRAFRAPVEEETGGDERALVYHGTAFIVYTFDLVKKPRIGDKIADTRGASYEVTKNAGGKVWEYGDVFQTAVKIHVKEVWGI